jgi:hypothetical protein
VRAYPRDAHARGERPASGAQLYRLNELGLLDEAMYDGYVTALQARLVLTAVAERGEWEPEGLRLKLSFWEREWVERYNRNRERDLR